MDADQLPTVRVTAGRRRDGSLVEEELAAESLGEGRFKLLRSPGLTLGLAAGDVFVLDGQRSPQPVSRGGDLCIQIIDRVGVAWARAAVRERLLALNGRVDGETRELLVLTVPVRAGFEAVERLMNSLQGASASLTWFYGNVYDPRDGTTPLNWWTTLSS
jgi:hypothetical protein